MKEIKSIYHKYVENMKKDRYIRSQECFDERNEFVTLFNLSKDSTGKVIDIVCPINHIISIYGTKQVPKNVDLRMAFALRVVLSDKDNNEIDYSTKVLIKKEGTNKKNETIEVSYSDINIKDSTSKYKSDARWYRFSKSFQLEYGDRLEIDVIKPNIDIDSNKTKLAFDVDIWKKSIRRDM